MAAITVQTPGTTEATLTQTACAALGDTVVNNGKTLLIFENGSGAPIDVTVDSDLCSFGFEHDCVVTVGAGLSVIAGPFEKALYGTTLTITYASVTSLTIAAVSP